MHGSRVVLSVNLVEVCNHSLNVRRTVLGHVFTDRREVAEIVATQIGYQARNQAAAEANRYIIVSTTADDA